MRILFLGGTRFIGRAGAVQLAEAGHEVTVFHRGKSDAPMPDTIQHIHGDLAHLPDFAGTFRALAPDVVVHMMLLTEAKAAHAMHLFKGITPRVVIISSMDVYLAWGRLLNTEPGDPEPLPLTEDSPLREQFYPYREVGERDWRYDYDKILVERAAFAAGNPAATVLRLPMVYGEYDYQRRLLPYVQRMADERPYITMDARQAEWIAPRAYIDNVGHAIALAATDDRAAGRTYHLADTQALTEAEWVRAIGEAAGWQGALRILPPEQLPAEMQFNPRGQNLTVDSTRIRSELDYADITPFAEGVRRTVQWTKTHLLPDAAPIDYTQEDNLTPP